VYGDSDEAFHVHGGNDQVTTGSRLGSLARSSSSIGCCILPETASAFRLGFESRRRIEP
jgi:hypothetical protein